MVDAQGNVIPSLIKSVTVNLIKSTRGLNATYVGVAAHFRSKSRHRAVTGNKSKLFTQGPRHTATLLLYCSTSCIHAVEKTFLLISCNGNNTKSHG